MKFQRLKFLFLLFLLAAGAGMIWLLYAHQPRTPFDATLAPAYQLLGRTAKSLDRALTRVVPVNEIDEKEYGMAIAQRYEVTTDKTSKEFWYLNDIMGDLQRFARKPFSYRVYVVSYAQPNAFALPGGVIFVTAGLLGVLQSEAELVSVLAHEMGHIELSHCFDAVRFSLLTKKMGSRSLGELADFAVNALFRHSYSKTQEDEADEYAFTLITNTPYDPLGVGNGFASVVNFKNRSGSGRRSSHQMDPFQEYFMTHPHLELRSEKFSERGRIWWMKNKSEKRYVGKTNLAQRVFLKKTEFPHEWIQEGKKEG